MTRLRRFSAALAAALLLFSTQADVYASSHCEHHAAPTAAPADQGEHSHHGAGVPAEAEKEHAVCTCLGMCAASVAAVSVAAPESIAGFTPPGDVVTRITVEATVLPGFTRHLIPFATAPPAVS